MAGRGTDILLGGNPEFLAKEALKRQGINPDEAEPEQIEDEVIKTKRVTESEHNEVVGLGGLHILGTERHESRRIDNQLRGRSGRQGDPGSSRFYLSLEDDLMRIFAGDKVRALMKRFGLEDGMAIESRMVSKRVEGAQKSVEGHNFTIRKQLIEYDDVMNKQRETIYGLRRQLLEELNQREYILGIGEDLLNDYVDQYMDKAVYPDDWDIAGFKLQLKSVYGFDADAEGIDFKTSSRDEIKETIWSKLQKKYETKEQQVGPEAMRYYERIIMLNIVDAAWKDHLLNIDHLKDAIHLRGYGQKDPLVEYKRETYGMFQTMLDRIDTDTTRMLFNLQVASEEPPPQTVRRPRGSRGRLTYTKANASAAAAGDESDKPKTIVRNQPKVGRNDPCPCGSGLKYKKCHGS
jgi:preprotein translocase subunit SecA